VHAGEEGHAQPGWTGLSVEVNQNDRGQREMEKVRPWCGQPSDRGQLKNRTDINDAYLRSDSNISEQSL